MSADKIRLRAGFVENAALTQLHRWYQIYENPAVNLENTLDILAPDISIKSATGKVSGHDEYKAYLAQIPTGLKNAHFVRDARISEDADGRITMIVDIVFENAGINKDGSFKQADIAYATKLEPTDGILPKFSEMQISQIKDGTTSAMRSAYGENRMLSLVHYWLAILDNPSKDPAPAQEIFADAFSLNFSTGTITDFSAFEKWYLERAAPIVANTHKLSNFSYTQSKPGAYQVTVDFAWEGLVTVGKLMGAKTRHHWIVEDNPADRFAKIKSMDVEILEPFAPKAASQPMTDKVG